MSKCITCRTCPRCKDTYPGKLDRDGNHFYICGIGGNMVYKEPRKVKRALGKGYIHYSESSCGLYGSIEEALENMTRSERERYYESMEPEKRQISIFDLVGEGEKEND